MPARNEAELRELSVEGGTEGLRGRTGPFGGIVVERGSRAATPEIADRLAASTPEVVTLHLDLPDYGAALRAGLLAAEGDIVVNYDVDYYDLGFVADALGRLAADDQPAIVVGSKRAAGARDERHGLRRFVTPGFSGLLRYGFGLRGGDTPGMKATRREAA